ncbi:hypothetical protein ACOMHN_056342 [Nucella lapillus]
MRRLWGQPGLDEMNEDGKRFADLCAIHDRGTHQTTWASADLSTENHTDPVCHSGTHQTTWASPDLSAENHTDPVCIGKKFTGPLQEDRVRRGPDVASDHHLLTPDGNFRLTLRPLIHNYS